MGVMRGLYSGGGELGIVDADNSVSADDEEDDGGVYMGRTSGGVNMEGASDGVYLGGTASRGEYPGRTTNTCGRVYALVGSGEALCCRLERKKQIDKSKSSQIRRNRETFKLQIVDIYIFYL